MTRAMGIDLGSKRIGVAVSDSAGSVATPIETVPRSRDRGATHRRIAELVAEWECDVVVVGLPLGLDGRIGAAAQAALAEAEELHDTVGVPVETYDERLTTVTADRSLMQMNLNAGARRRMVDQVAAAVMLQAWLDRRRHAAPDPDEAL
jgi:putative Holliday junction resolvase